ncbi:MAG TPA: conjugative transfer ATPase, partial [Dokdonella sp.]
MNARAPDALVKHAASTATATTKAAAGAGARSRVAEKAPKIETGWVASRLVRRLLAPFMGPATKGAGALRSATVDERRRLAQRPPSFTELLPYADYDPEDQCFDMADGATMGAMFELEAIPTEARSMEYLAERAAKVQEALQAIAEEESTPWVVQFFANDDLDVSVLAEDLRDYVAKVHEDYPERQKAVMSSAITQAVLQMYEDHLKQVSNPNGLFYDSVVCKQPWRGQRRRVRCCLYRRFLRRGNESVEPREQLDAVASTLMATLSEAGCKPRRCSAKDLYEWLLPFFNPNVPWANSYSGELLKRMPYPGDSSVPEGSDAAPIFGADLAELLNLSEPRSDMEHGCFEFDGRPVKAIALQSMRQQPQLGHFSAELKSGDESFARLDRLPAGSMLSITVNISPQNRVEQHIERIRDASRANTPTARETHHECERVLDRLIQGDKLFPMQLMLYLSAPSHALLKESVNQVRSMLNPSGLKFVEHEHELLPLDTFLRGLPFNFDPLFDVRHLRRTKLVFASHIAALLPVYGRSHGTPHPGMWFWNRGGEPLWVDPLNKRDRKKSAHLLMLGPTGAGKSATANGLFAQAMAIHRPRLVIADAGKSFELTVQFCKEHGLSVHYVNLTGDADVSLPPFLFAHRILEDRELVASFAAAERQARENAGLPKDELLERLANWEEPAAEEAPV